MLETPPTTQIFENIFLFVRPGNSYIIAPTEVDTLTVGFPDFPGVNVGFPCTVCTNGFPISLLRSLAADEPDALKRSVQQFSIKNITVLQKWFDIELLVRLVLQKYYQKARHEVFVKR